MAGPQEIPFGRWPSPLSAHQAAQGRIGRSDLRAGPGGPYWAETRPADQGRTVVVRATGPGRTVVVSPPGVSVRSKVHAYGGGAFCVLPPQSRAGALGEPRLIYVDAADQRVWLSSGPGAPRALTGVPPAGESWHHGDLAGAPLGDWVLAIRERIGGTAGDLRTEIFAIDPERPEAAGTVLGGPEFLAGARLSPRGDRLAWIRWDPRSMPWDTSELWVAGVGRQGDRLVLTEPPPTRVAGGPAESVGQPQWLAHGELLFASDAAGWWQPWLFEQPGGVRRLCGAQAEFHDADWVLGTSTMAELPGGALAWRWRQAGRDVLGIFDRATARVYPMDQPCVAISAVSPTDHGVVFIGRTPDQPAALWEARFDQDHPPPPSPVGVARAPQLLTPAAPGLAAEAVSVAQPLAVARPHGEAVRGLFFAPAAPGLAGRPAEKPPLVVFCHGGPTGSADPGFDPVVQFFTTRGFAVALVDYAGSTGYGRAFRQSLAGRWGIADVADCVAAAAGLAAQGAVDGDRMVIRGTSAGGFTALSALAASRVFQGATAFYPVSDLLEAAPEHPFEAHYNDFLVGPLPVARAELLRRSLVNRVDQMAGSVLLFHGRQDPVVPEAHSAALAAALARQGVPCTYRVLQDQGHGFRSAEALAGCLEEELGFYQRILGIAPGGRAGRAGRAGTNW